MSDVVTQLHRCVASGEFDFELLKKLQSDGASVQECEVLDFKEKTPVTDAEYAKAMRDLVALHNSHGGFLAFGVREIMRDRVCELIGLGTDEAIDLGKLRSCTRNYLSSELRMQSFLGRIGELTIEVIWVAKRAKGEAPVKFIKNGPDLKPREPVFKKEDVIFRRLDSNALAKSADDFDFLYSERRPLSIDLTPWYGPNSDHLEHNLPDRTFICPRFVGRAEDLGDLWTWLRDDFSRVRLIAGEGGLGKTSLAYRFAEDVASRKVKPFLQVVWLSAKKLQFLPSLDKYGNTPRTDFEDATSLYEAVALAHACLEKDFEGLDSRGLQMLALEACSAMPSLIVIDDVDSMTPVDQQRALELGMKTPAQTKMLLTTRVNFSYSPDNVLKLDGLRAEDFKAHVRMLREKYQLSEIRESKIDHIHETSGGSPLFTDSILRLERRGLSLDQAIKQWKGQKGLEARKAALRREVEQLSKEAKRVLFVICHTKSVSYVELSQIVDYADQTLGDALQELAGLFLVRAPSIGREARYTVDSNTALLVIESASSLNIDHTKLIEATKRSRSDAIGIGRQRRSDIVGQAIYQATATQRNGDSKGALDTIISVSKKLKRSHPDLLLAEGRFSLKLDQPDLDQASKAFVESYALGQRKQLLFDLWFDTEFRRGDYATAEDVTSKAIEHEVGDVSRWYERRAQIHVALARRSNWSISVDLAIREIEKAIDDLKRAKSASEGEIQAGRLGVLLQQALDLRQKIQGFRR